mmetsp:Transcript_11602/g.20901  ORF Transcript_11602/g.20901 Transcript_11602/m.20901 type:complete len:410 (+) Transcript_11602:167-1396(+)|eukprot:CAMPEP_0201632488 /NCGR_PEP_ID=MMETSP0493-20130528/6107_1 /ASSEMBLY_ACC=CAM_ASM_000838 /TAXON_ID=420259 /ORGANISM="Thalassiosira gravida, Strain GMp14c1" /LENGTH=409 /DNA_ID=CAMNT_0048104017 /DNA_START=159 /DNA_END=1388 /DNA_ORIENTATION=+
MRYFLAAASAGYLANCNAFVSPRTFTNTNNRVLVVNNNIPHPPSFQTTALTAAVAALHDESLAPGIQAIDAAMPTLAPLFAELRSLPYFRLYSCDMLASCEYIPQELFECYTESCEIYPVDDDEVPTDIKMADFKEHEFELDGWARWDMPSEDYYDTLLFPEDYTGYDGAEVWRFIHDRIGFHDGAMSADEYDADDWKADFNKAVSGLHSMVSAQVIKGMREKINSGEGLDPDSYEWTDPSVEFNRRLGPQGETPEAVENLYFTMMLLLSGVRAARDRLLMDCDMGKVGDAQACQVLRSILTHPVFDDPSIEAASHRLRSHALKNSNSLWEARMRTRDLMRIMNCVQCNKCRFHGKISTLGLSTALQLSVGHRGAGGDAVKIHRVELAALVTAVGKFSSGIDLCLEMQP